METGENGPSRGRVLSPVGRDCNFPSGSVTIPHQNTGVNTVRGQAVGAQSVRVHVPVTSTHKYRHTHPNTQVIQVYVPDSSWVLVWVVQLGGLFVILSPRQQTGNQDTSALLFQPQPICKPAWSKLPGSKQSK